MKESLYMIKVKATEILVNKILIINYDSKKRIEIIKYM